MTKLLYCIGDVHGCFNALETLMDTLFEDAGENPAKFVFLGDYIDRGPDSALVVDYLNSLRLSSKDKHEFVFLRGNHEDMFIQGILDKQSRDHASMFYYNGGTATERSYKENNFLYEDHEEFYHSLERYHRDGEFFFVHAGLPATETMEEALYVNQWSEDDLYWTRAWNNWDGEFPENVFVVHGHTPVPLPDVKANQLNIDTGCVFGKGHPAYGNLTAVRLDSRDAMTFFSTREYPVYEPKPTPEVDDNF